MNFNQPAQIWDTRYFTVRVALTSNLTRVSQHYEEQCKLFNLTISTSVFFNKPKALIYRSVRYFTAIICIVWRHSCCGKNQVFVPQMQLAEKWHFFQGDMFKRWNLQVWRKFGTAVSIGWQRIFIRDWRLI